MNDDLVYALTKALREAYPLYKDMHHLASQATLENTLGKDWNLSPYHPGATRYFKELGAWTDHHEQRQQKLLADEAERIKKWTEKRLKK